MHIHMHMRMMHVRNGVVHDTELQLVEGRTSPAYRVGRILNQLLSRARVDYSVSVGGRGGVAPFNP